jgi:hypothetical protein
VADGRIPHPSTRQSEVDGRGSGGEGGRWGGGGGRLGGWDERGSPALLCFAAQNDPPAYG